LKQEPRVITCFGKFDGLALAFGHIFGMLGYIHFEREVAALPYMTPDFIRMKYWERSIAKSFGGKAYLTLYIYLIRYCNWIWNTALVHLDKRGIHTNYWVLNNDADFKEVAEETSVAGLMTDRPSAIKTYLIMEEMNMNKKLN